MNADHMFDNATVNVILTSAALAIISLLTTFNFPFVTLYFFFIHFTRFVR